MLSISLIRSDWVPAIVNLDRDRLAEDRVAWLLSPQPLDTMIAQAQFRRRITGLATPPGSEQLREQVARTLAYPLVPLPTGAGNTGLAVPSLTPVASAQHIASMIAGHPQADTMPTRRAAGRATAAYPLPVLNYQDIPAELVRRLTLHQVIPVAQGGRRMEWPSSRLAAESFPGPGDRQLARPISPSWQASGVGELKSEVLPKPMPPAALYYTVPRSTRPENESSSVGNQFATTAQRAPEVGVPNARTGGMVATGLISAPHYQEVERHAVGEVDALVAPLQQESPRRVEQAQTPLPADNNNNDDVNRIDNANDAGDNDEAGDGNGHNDELGNTRYHNWHKYCGPPLPITVDGGGKDPQTIIQDGKYLCSLCSTKVSSQALLSRHFVLHKVGNLRCPFRRIGHGMQWQSCSLKFHRWHVLQIILLFKTDLLLTFT